MHYGSTVYKEKLRKPQKRVARNDDRSELKEVVVLVDCLGLGTYKFDVAAEVCYTTLFEGHRIDCDGATLIDLQSRTM